MYYVCSLCILTTILSNNYHGKWDWPCLQTYNLQTDLPMPQHNVCCTTTLCVLTDYYSSNCFIADMIALNQPSPVSNLIPTNKVDTDVNNDDNFQSFVNHRKHNHSATKICDANATTTQVQLKFHQII